MHTPHASSAAALLICLPVSCSPLAIQAQPPPLLLAADYDNASELETSEYLVSEKLDGIRAYWDGNRLYTRQGNVVHAPDWFSAGWPREPLDGELWIGRGKFEQLAATVRDLKPDDAAWREVRYMLFDLPSAAGPFTARQSRLRALIAGIPSNTLRVLEQWRVNSEAELQRRLTEVVAAGGEGLMLHRGSSPYRAERSDDLLKLKPTQDAEAQVVGYSPGKGKYAGMVGALYLQRPDGVRFKVGSGMTDEQRRRPPPLGSSVTYSYQSLTARGVPRFARFVRVHRAAEEKGSDRTHNAQPGGD